MYDPYTPNECLSHRVLSDPARDVHPIQALNPSLCDSNLQTLWYKFEINKHPAEIATSCLKVNNEINDLNNFSNILIYIILWSLLQPFQCGTKYPIWLPINATESNFGNPQTLPRKFEIKSYQVCISRGNQCCAKKFLIHVRNCGDFMVYFIPYPSHVRRDLPCASFCTTEKSGRTGTCV